MRARKMAYYRVEEREFGDSKSRLALLSDDTLQLILECLPDRFILHTVALVCKRWERISQSCAIRELTPTRTAPFDKPWDHLDAGNLLRLVEKHSHGLQTLHLHAVPGLEGHMLIKMTEALPNLKNLSVVACTSITHLDLETAITVVCTELEVLDLHCQHFPRVRGQSCPNCRNDNILITDNLILNLIARCHRMKGINMDDCSEVTPETVKKMCIAYPGLTSVSLHSDKLGWETVRNLLSNCKELLHLSLVSSELGEQSDVFYHQTKIKSLRLNKNHHRSIAFDKAPSMHYLMTFGNSLSDFYVQSQFLRTWDTLKLVGRDLQVVDISHAASPDFICSKRELDKLVWLIDYCPRVKRLALPHANDEVLLKVASTCHNLEELRFQGFGNGGSLNKLVTDIAIAQVTEKCTQLKVLSVGGCKRVTSSSLRFLANNCRKLHTLHLDGCQGVDDRLFNTVIQTALPKLLRSLRFLDIQRLKSIGKIVDRLTELPDGSACVLQVLVLGRKLLPPLRRQLLEARFPQLMVWEKEFFWDGLMYSHPLLAPVEDY